MTDQSVGDFDVIICGAGPSGVLLAAYLAQQAYSKVLLLDKVQGIVTDPRGICTDEETVRMLQGLNLYEDVRTRIGHVPDWVRFQPDSYDLHQNPIFRLNQKLGGGHGLAGTLFHEQPRLEASVRSVFEKRENSVITFLEGCEVTGIEEAEDSVTVLIKSINDGIIKRAKAKFLVGADGKMGYVRKNYLEAKGVFQEDSNKLAYTQWWVALNLQLSLPTPETHPDFPLFKLGYTGQQVYDAFFPEDFRFICSPQRPSVCGRFGLYERRLWRFEYILNETEDPMEMAKEDEWKKIVFPYLTHEGSRYGLDGKIMYPEDCINVRRCRPFKFKAQVANTWAIGRTMLIGDAAHNFPPFGGQGIASGFRDAFSLAWRLSLLAAYPELRHEELLTAWYEERKQQVEESLALTVFNGNMVCQRSVILATARNVIIKVLCSSSNYFRESLEATSRGKLMKYRYQKGLCFLEQKPAGVYLPQVHAWQNGKHVMTDDIIFPKSKDSHFFQLLILAETLDKARNIEAQLSNLATRDLSHQMLNATHATYLISDRKSAQNQNSGDKFLFVMSSEEYEKEGFEPSLPGYNGERIRNEVNGATFVVVRPDRFIFGVSKTITGFQEILIKLAQMFFE